MLFLELAPKRYSVIFSAIYCYKKKNPASTHTGFFRFCFMPLPLRFHLFFGIPGLLKPPQWVYKQEMSGLNLRKP